MIKTIAVLVIVLLSVSIAFAFDLNITTAFDRNNPHIETVYHNYKQCMGSCPKQISNDEYLKQVLAEPKQEK
jgi:hypothetical protein